MSDRELEGRVALVTGAAGGIGSAVVSALAARGAVVVGWDIAGSTDAEASSRNVHEHVRFVDVTDAGAVAQALDAIETDIGPVEIGVNVAGALVMAPVIDTDDATWRRLFAVNTDGVFNVSRALATRMLPRRRGTIITVSSNAAGIPRAGLAAYAASKAAATMFTRCLGLELAPSGIRCNAVAPGSTRTPMLDATLAEGADVDGVIRGSLDTFRTGIPLGRVAEPADVAEAVCFLASDRARHIALTTLYVDGGATLHG